MNINETTTTFIKLTTSKEVDSTCKCSESFNDKCIFKLNINNKQIQ